MWKTYKLIFPSRKVWARPFSHSLFWHVSLRRASLTVEGIDNQLFGVEGGERKRENLKMSPATILSILQSFCREFLILSSTFCSDFHFEAGNVFYFLDISMNFTRRVRHLRVSLKYVNHDALQFLRISWLLRFLRRERMFVRISWYFWSQDYFWMF